MKLLSLWEPWATLMAIGAKRIETRSWHTRYRGYLAIHASKGGLPKRLLADCLTEPGFDIISADDLRPGCIVAVVRLVDCRPTVTLPDSKLAYGPIESVFAIYPELDTAQERNFGDYSPGRWAWVTEHIFRLPQPIEFRAKQGLLDLAIRDILLLRDQWHQLGRPQAAQTPEDRP